MAAGGVAKSNTLVVFDVRINDGGLAVCCQRSVTSTKLNQLLGQLDTLDACTVVCYSSLHLATATACDATVLLGTCTLHRCLRARITLRYQHNKHSKSASLLASLVTRKRR